MSTSVGITPQGPVPAINVPNTQDYPRLALTSPYFSTVPFAELLQPSVNEAVEAVLPGLIPPYIDQAAQDAVSQLAVLRTGDAMTGPLLLSPTMPTQPAQAASMAYVESMFATGQIPEVPPVPANQVWARETGQWVPIEQATGVIPEAPTDGRVYARNGQTLSWVPALPLAGGTLTGALTLPGNATGPLQAIPLQQLGTLLSSYVPLTGNVSVTGPLTMSGATANLTLNGNATTSLEAVPLQQLNTAVAGVLPLTGGQLTGPLYSSSGPIGLGDEASGFFLGRIAPWRMLSWNPDWFDGWDEQTGIRVWIGPGSALLMELDASGNLTTSGTVNGVPLADLEARVAGLEARMATTLPA